MLEWWVRGAFQKAAGNWLQNRVQSGVQDKVRPVAQGVADT